MLSILLPLLVVGATARPWIVTSTDERCVRADDVASGVRQRLPPGAALLETSAAPVAGAPAIRIEIISGERAVLRIDGIEGERHVGPVRSCEELTRSTTVVLAVVLETLQFSATLAAPAPSTPTPPAPATPTPPALPAPPAPSTPTSAPPPPATSTTATTSSSKWPIELSFRGGATAGHGPAPGARVGVTGALVLADHLSLQTALFVEGSTAPAGSGALTVVAVGLAPRVCARETLAGIGRATIDVCGLAEFGAALAAGSGVADGRLGGAPQLAVGAALEVGVPLSSSWALVVGSTLQVPLARLRLNDSSSGRTLYEQPIVNGVVEAGARFVW